MTLDYRWNKPSKIASKMPATDLTTEKDSPELVAQWDGRALWLRVGSFYQDGDRHPDACLWVCYQNKYLNSALQGPLCIDKGTWSLIRDRIDDWFSKAEHGDRV